MKRSIQCLGVFALCFIAGSALASCDKTSSTSSSTSVVSTDSSIAGVQVKDGTYHPSFQQYYDTSKNANLLNGLIVQTVNKSGGVIGEINYAFSSASFSHGELEPVRHIKDRVSLAIALSSLIGCIVCLAVSNYIHLEMYLVSLGFAVADIIALLIVGLIKKDVSLFPNLLKRIPYDVIPFVLSMFAFVLALTKYGVSQQLSNWLSSGPKVFTFGISSFFACDLMNNIPMSVLFASIISSGGNSLEAVYASIIGSNLGALLTPIGALAGIMWLSLLHKDNINLSFGKFILYGAPIALVSIVVALGGLWISMTYLV